MNDKTSNAPYSQEELIHNMIEQLASSLVLAFPKDPKFGITLVFATTSKIDQENFAQILKELPTKLQDETLLKNVLDILSGLRDFNTLDPIYETHTTRIINRFISAMNNGSK